jgi:HK97 family phage major capsid protein
MATAIERGAPAGIATGSKEVDAVNDQAWSGPGHPEDTPLRDLLMEALTKGYTYSIGRAVQSLAAEQRLGGFEGEVNAEMAVQMGKTARGFWVPWDAPIERRSLTTAGGAGSITAQVPYMLLIDVLRPKLAIARLGGRVLNLIGNGPKGDVQLSTKGAASTVSWVGEGSAPASSSNLVSNSFVMKPYTVTAYSDVTRRMLKLGAPGFEDQIIDDISVGLGVGIDQTALNGSTPNQPMGLFQFSGIPSVGAHGDAGNGGTITYSVLVAMNQMVGLYNGDSPMTAKLGWVTSPQGRATLSLTDKSATVSTGRYCWESHAFLVDGEVVTVESVLGYPAVATTNAPSALTEGTSSAVTAIAHGNFDDCWINLFSGFDCMVNPFLQSINGVVRVSGFQDVDVRFVRPSAFCVCSNIAAISPQTS